MSPYIHKAVYLGFHLCGMMSSNDYFYIDSRNAYITDTK